jgi:hypothetical protein
LDILPSFAFLSYKKKKNNNNSSNDEDLKLKLSDSSDVRIQYERVAKKRAATSAAVETIIFPSLTNYYKLL